jgi:hypothetical protein
MKLIGLGFFIALILMGNFGVAAERSTLKQTSAVVWLSPRDLENAQLVVNASSRARYALKVDNPEVVEAWVKNQPAGLVRVVVEFLEATSKVRVLSIQPARTRRVPTYDGELVAVGRGNG